MAWAARAGKGARVVDSTHQLLLASTPACCGRSQERAGTATEQARAAISIQAALRGRGAGQAGLAQAARSQRLRRALT